MRLQGNITNAEVHTNWIYKEHLIELNHKHSTLIWHNREEVSNIPYLEESPYLIHIEYSSSLSNKCTHINRYNIFSHSQWVKIISVKGFRFIRKLGIRTSNRALQTCRWIEIQEYRSKSTASTNVWW